MSDLLALLFIIFCVSIFFNGCEKTLKYIGKGTHLVVQQFEEGYYEKKRDG